VQLQQGFGLGLDVYGHCQFSSSMTPTASPATDIAERVSEGLPPVAQRESDPPKRDPFEHGQRAFFLIGQALNFSLRRRF
jgi:hypothetical protein